VTNQDLEVRINQLVQDERRITVELLRLINLAEDRRLHLERGFSSLFDWLTVGLGYSNSSAQRRIDSARCLRVEPAVETKLRSGSLNLTNLAKAQTSIRAQQKKTGRRMTATEQAEVLKVVENKTTADAELALLQHLPDTASIINQERTKRLNAEETRLSLNFTNEDLENLAWIKDFLSHAMPEATTGQILAELMRRFRAKQSTTAAVVKITKARRRSCEYKDEGTGRICGSTYRIEVDHVVPRALGGGDDPSNLRCLCRRHNQFVATQWLGPGWANAWRREPRLKTSSRCK
jgi:hypothetical protein